MRQDALLIGFIFLGLQTFQAGLLKRAMGQEENFLARRLASGLAGVLNQAHKMKDDLSIYQVVDALAKSPGIIQARIVVQASPEMYSYPLQDGAQTWGNLEFSISDHFSRTLIREQWLAGTAAAALIWGALFLYLQFLERRTSGLQTQTAELEGLLQMEKLKRNDSEQRERSTLHQRAVWLQDALEQIPRPLLLLDGRQRVMAANSPAAALLDTGEPQDLLGKSWQDIPGLNDCGSSLVESLEAPGFPVRRIDGLSGRITEFFTMTSKEGSSGGTWVSFLGGLV